MMLTTCILGEIHLFIVVIEIEFAHKDLGTFYYFITQLIYLHVIPNH